MRYEFEISRTIKNIPERVNIPNNYHCVMRWVGGVFKIVRQSE